MPPRASTSTAILLLLLGVSATAAQERWTLTEELRIGSVDDPATALSRVGDLLVAQDGRIYVSQSQQKEIRIYSPEGELLRVIGGEGAGPGEFRDVSSLFWRGDTLQVLDFAQQRFSLFTADGDLIRTYRPLPRGAIVRHLVYAEFPDGSVYARTRGSADDGTVALLRIRGPGPPDTIARVKGGQPPQAIVPVGDKVVATFLPLWPSDRTALSPRAETITIVNQPQPESPDSAFFRVRRITAVGEVLFETRFRYAPRPIGERGIEGAVARQMEGLARRLDASQGAAERLANEAMEKFLGSGAALPAYHVPVAGVMTGEDGKAWLRLRTEDGQRRQWLVLDQRGELIARLSVPESVNLHFAAETHVWGVELDELDVPYVVRYEVRRVSGGRSRARGGVGEQRGR